MQQVSSTTLQILIKYFIYKNLLNSYYNLNFKFYSTAYNDLLNYFLNNILLKFFNYKKRGKNNNSKIFFNKFIYSKNYTLFERVKNRIRLSASLKKKKTYYLSHYKPKLKKSFIKQVKHECFQTYYNPIKFINRHKLLGFLFTKKTQTSLLRNFYLVNTTKLKKLYLKKYKTLYNTINYSLFYYKLIISLFKNKNAKTRTIFHDLHTKFLILLQNARKLHWQYADYTVLREHNYKRFLKKDVRYYYKTSLNRCSLFTFCYLTKLIFSEKQFIELINLRLFLLNFVPCKKTTLIEKFDVLSFITGEKITLYFLLIKNLILKHKKKLRRWYYMQYLYLAKPHLQKKKKSIPKITEKMSPKDKHILLNTQYDWNSGSVLFITAPIFGLLSPRWLLRYTKVLKLYSWRYRAE